jgi:hypothetical protein
MLQLFCDWADASLECRRQCKGNKGNNASAMGAKAPTRQSNDAGATVATMTA